MGLKVNKRRWLYLVVPRKIASDLTGNNHDEPNSVVLSARGFIRWIRVNDPSAGSPTETLLRLLLPLNKQVSISSGTPTHLTAERHSIPKTH